MNSKHSNIMVLKSIPLMIIEVKTSIALDFGMVSHEYDVVVSPARPCKNSSSAEHSIQISSQFCKIYTAFYVLTYRK